MAQTGCVLLTHDMHPYGAQRLIAGLINTLAREHPMEMELVSLGGGSLAADLRHMLPIHMTGASWKSQSRRMEPIADLLARRGYRRAILNTVVAGSSAPVFAQCGFEVISLIHEMPTLIRDEGLAARLSAIYQHSRAVVYPHASVRDANQLAFPDLPATRAVHCIAQGLIRRNPYRNDKAAVRSRVRRELDLPDNCPIVLGVGLGDVRKGFDRFLACASRINATAPNVCFLWIGPPGADLLNAWKATHPQTESVTSRLRMPGYVDDTAPFHAAADLFFLSSREDPFPFVALESLDAGVPILAFRGSGGGADLAQNVAGTVVAAGNDEALDVALMTLLNDDAQRTRMGEASARFADAECSFGLYVRRLLALFSDNDGAGSKPAITRQLSDAVV